MEEKEPSGYGVGDVVILALRDMDFFELLFREPREAIEERKSRGQLERVTAEDIDRIEAYVLEQRTGPTRQQMIEIQRRLRGVPQWDPPTWPASVWPPFRPPHP